MIDKIIEEQLEKYIIENYDEYNKNLIRQCQILDEKQDADKHTMRRSMHYELRVLFDETKHLNQSKKKIKDWGRCCCYNIPPFETSPKFAKVLFKFIDEKNMTDVECYKKAGVDRRLFSKIKSDKDYQPSKKTILAFALSLKLNKEETIELLSSGGYTLSHSYLRDVIIEYCITNNIYDIFDVNDLLSRHNEELIIFE